MRRKQKCEKRERGCMCACVCVKRENERRMLCCRLRRRNLDSILSFVFLSCLSLYPVFSPSHLLLTYSQHTQHAQQMNPVCSAARLCVQHCESFDFSRSFLFLISSHLFLYHLLSTHVAIHACRSSKTLWSLGSADETTISHSHTLAHLNTSTSTHSLAHTHTHSYTNIRPTANMHPTAHSLGYA